ncbi:MAG TPA: HEAT repeat domain-containing protein [Streptomyces sp.]|nr:HEAT repeat domain-containing protein [Streptomyces sp.]
MRNSADDSGEHLRFDAFLDQLPDRSTRFDPRPRTWLLTGGAGSGKSTAILQCAIALLERETPCVVVDNRTIRQLDVHGLSVKDLARELRPSGIDEPLWKQHVKKSRVVFLVDALNELEREFDDTPEWKFIRRLVAGSHDFTVVATSRGRFDALEWTVQRDVDTLSIEPLGEQDIETYLGMRDGSATEALTEIRTGDMLGVASNPFMLTLLTDWLLGTRSVKDRKIPRSRADLLRETVVRPGSEGRFGETRAEREAAKRGLGMEAALCAAALAAITTGKGNADFLAVDVEALLGRVWGGEEAIGRTVKGFLETQMVQPVGDPADRQYSLLHPAFVDFGLALAWQNTSPPPVVLDPGYLDQCLGDWVGLQPDPDSAVLGLLGLLADDAAPAATGAAPGAAAGALSGTAHGTAPGTALGAALGAAAALSGRAGTPGTPGAPGAPGVSGTSGAGGTPAPRGTPAIPSRPVRHVNPLPPELIVDILLANRGVLGDEVRGVLWRQLGDCFTQGRQIRDRLAGALAGVPRTVLRDGFQRGLLRALNANDPVFADIILAALWNGLLDAPSLQRLRRTHQRNKRESAPRTPGRDDAAAAKRRAWLREDPDPLARRRSANWLSVRGGEQDVDDLQAAMRDDTDAAVRGASATALGRIGMFRALPALVATIGSDRNAVVRGSAASALGRIGRSEAVPSLTAAVTDDPDANVRGSAANALGLIGHSDAVTALIRGLADDNASVRGSSANALGLVGRFEAIPALTATLAGDREAHVRGSAANALGLIGHPEAVPTLTAALVGDDDNHIRGSAANALGLIGHPEAIPVLTRALAGDANANVRGSAANALGLIGHPEAIPALTTALGSDTDANVRGSSAGALGRIGHPGAVEALTATLVGDKDAGVRGSAANALGRTGHPEAIPALTTALAEEADSHTRGSAANALGLIGHAEAVPALAALLAEDENGIVRGSAANALGRIGHSAALPALTAALADDRDGHTRGSAANALGRIGDSAALPALTAALTDDDDKVRGSAANALGRISDPAAVPALTRAITDDPDDKVRGSAANALGHIGSPEAADILRHTIRNPDETYVTRRAAVGSLTHLDTGDESWITEVADRLRYTTRGNRAGRALRGAIVDLVGRREITPETKDWLVRVIHYDRDKENRTTALEGLARAGEADADLIKFIIAPERPRPDKRLRDSDAGVLGVAAAAVVRVAADDPDYTESLLPSVVRLLTQKTTYPATISKPFNQLRLLPLPVADRVFSRLVELVAKTPPENPYLETALAAERDILAERKRVQADVESFGLEPEAVLAGFREQRKSRFEVTTTGTGTATGAAEGTGTGVVGAGAAGARGDEYHVALLTAVPVEAKALFSVLAERGIARTSLQRNGRYYDVFELISADQRPVRVVTTLATDQGGQPAAAVTHELLSVFRPHLVLLVGVCGGFPEHGVAPGDVLLARAVFDYGPERVRPGGGGGRPQVYRGDEQVQRLFTALDVRGDLDKARGEGTLRVMDFASGEKVIAWREAELRAQLLDLSVDIGGVETEAHGVLHAIWETFKAKDFVGGAMLKCVSDLGDEEMAVDKQAKQTAAAQRAARVALDLVAAFRREDA